MEPDDVWLFSRVVHGPDAQGQELILLQNHCGESVQVKTTEDPVALAFIDMSARKRAVHLGADGVEHGELVRFFVKKGTVDMRRKHGSKAHMKITSSSAIIPVFQSSGEVAKSGVAHGFFDSEPAAVDKFALGHSESKLAAAEALGQLVDGKASDSGRVPVKAGPPDSGYGGVHGKRSRSPSPNGLDDLAATSGPIHKRQKSEVEQLDENGDHGLPAALSPRPTTQENIGARDDVNRGPLHAGHAGNTETGIGYPPNNTPDHGPSATNTATTAVPLSGILNDENVTSAVAGASSAGVEATLTGMGLANSPGQAGSSNFATNQPHLPSQVPHGLSAAVKVSVSDQGLQPPGPAFTEPAASRGPGTGSSSYPAFTASDNATHQPPIYIDQDNGATQYSQSSYDGFITANSSAAPENPVTNQGPGGGSSVSYNQAVQASLYAVDGYGEIEYPQTQDANSNPTIFPAAGVPSGSQGLQQPAAVPPISHTTVAGPANQGYQQPEGVPLNTPAVLIPDIEAQQPPIYAGLENPNKIAHAILDGDAPHIRPDQLWLVIVSVAQHLDIELPSVGPLGPVGPGILDNLLGISISTGARLNGPAGDFNAWEASFLRAIIPPLVVTSLSNVPDPPHGDLPPRTRDISSAD